MYKPSGGPGPGSYVFQGDFAKQKAKRRGFTFGAKPHRLQKKSGVPGPGYYNSDHYDIKTGRHRGPRYTMQKKYHRHPSEPKKDFVPGPGYYPDPDNPRRKFGKSGPKLSFGQKYRDRSHRKDNSGPPGPGYYEVNAAFRRSKGPGPRLSMAKKSWRRPPKDYVPGPGNYDPKHPNDNKKGRGRSFGVRPYRPNKKGHVPGPGLYDPKKAHMTKWGDKSKGYTMPGRHPSADTTYVDSRVAKEIIKTGS